MASIPKVLPNQQEEVIRIQYNNIVFLLTVHKGSDTHIVYIGGPHTYCINFQIYLENSIYKNFIDINTCLLDHFYYDKLCSISGGFQRGVDTALIFHLGITYIKNNYSHIKKIKLKDYSTRECNNGYSINLYEKFYITKGKTWYQEKYGAYLSDNDAKKFETKHAQFNEKKQQIDWNTMKQFITTNILPNNIEEYYNGSKTWQEFFTKLESSMGVAAFGEFISPWISTFLSSVMKYDFTAPYYYIDINVIPNMNYTQVGGGVNKKQYTRKRKMFSSKLLV
jgi:hypothetical protein